MNLTCVEDLEEAERAVPRVLDVVAEGGGYEADVAGLPRTVG